MAEGMDNVEGRQSCDDSSYNECTLRLPTAAVKNSGGGTDAQGKEPYQFEGTETEDNFATVHPGPTSAQDSLEPLQLALVLICMRTHTNEHVLQFSLCAGGCMWW